MEKVGNESTNSKNEESRSVIPSTKLFHLIASVKEINMVTNIKEILDGLKKYICTKQLFDPLNPRKIHCKDDELSSVLGVQEFSIHEVASFIPKLVSPVNSEAISNSIGNICKRRSEGTCTAAKKSKLDEIIIYIPPSPTRCNVSDSAESFQGYETAVVKDTSDESTCFSEDDNFNIIGVEETYNIEYEVEDLSSDIYSHCSDGMSDPETDVLKSAIITVMCCKSDSDMEFWADKSSDDDFYGFDAEISDSDKWTCNTCNVLNDPRNRFCERCFETRKGWLSSKRKTPKRKSRSKRKRVSMQKTISKQKESPINNRINVCDFPSTSSSQENKSSQSSEKERKHSNNLNFDLNSNSSNTKLCFLCCERPANGTIVHAHNKYAHTITCYPCARKLKDRKKRCPICRRKIDRVVCQILP